LVVEEFYDIAYQQLVLLLRLDETGMRDVKGGEADIRRGS
jgi:hypothetical protein